MNRDRSNWRGYLFAAPATLYLVAFSILPMGVAFVLSLHDWHLVKPDRRFVGLGNYRELAADPFFRNAVVNSLEFALLSVPFGMVVALGAAVLVNQRLRGVAVFRTLYYLPAVSSGVALAMVWIWVFLPRVGLINGLCRRFGFSGETDFLNDTRFAMLALVFMSVWIGLGPRMVIFLAGLKSIPMPLYESAQLDGCGAWARFRHVTLPMLLPTTFFVLVTSTIAAFQWFTPVYMMTQGGPRRTTDVVAYHIYKQAWHRFEIGMAGAQTYVLFFLIVAVALVQFRVMRNNLLQAERMW